MKLNEYSIPANRSKSLLLVLGLLLFAVHPNVYAESLPKVIAFAQDTLGNDWRMAQVNELRDALKGKQGIHFIETNANGSTAQQIIDIENLMNSRVDVLITSPRDAQLMAPLANKVMQNGIPLVLLSRTISSDDYTTFIHPDNRIIARQAARYIARKLNGQGNILILQHIPTTTPAIHRTEGFLEAIKVYPGLKVVDIKVANSLRADAIIQTEKAVEEKLQFDAIYAQSDSMAIGAIMALRKLGIDPKKIVITGIDYISEARQLIRSGELDASYTYPTAGKEGAQIALDILAGKSVPHEIVLDSTEVTGSNVELVEPIF